MAAGIVLAGALARIRKEDTVAEELLGEVADSVGVEEAPGSWLFAGQYKSFPRRQGC